MMMMMMMMMISSNEIDVAYYYGNTIWLGAVVCSLWDAVPESE